MLLLADKTKPYSPGVRATKSGLYYEATSKEIIALSRTEKFPPVPREGLGWILIFSVDKVPMKTSKQSKAT